MTAAARRGSAARAWSVLYPTVAEPGADVTALGPYAVAAGGQVVGGAQITVDDVTARRDVTVR